MKQIIKNQNLFCLPCTQTILGARDYNSPRGKLPSMLAQPKHISSS